MCCKYSSTYNKHPTHVESAGTEKHTRHVFKNTFLTASFLNLLSERPSQTLLLHRTAPRLTNDFLS